MAWSAPISKSTGDLVSASDWNINTVDNPTALLPAAIQFLFDGGGAAYGVDDPIYIEVPFKCDIVRVTMLHDQASTTTIDLWADTYANYQPTDADTITGGNEPATAAASKDQDATLTSWTKALAEGTILAANVDANDAATRTLLSLKVSRS